MLYAIQLLKLTPVESDQSAVHEATPQTSPACRCADSCDTGRVTCWGLTHCRRNSRRCSSSTDNGRCWDRCDNGSRVAFGRPPRLTVPSHGARRSAMNRNIVDRKRPILHKYFTFNQSLELYEDITIHTPCNYFWNTTISLLHQCNENELVPFAWSPKCHTQTCRYCGCSL